ncbi:MAG: 3-hydroxyacyl-CoA dehydrogenase family protein [Gammaproteobacteria bacterium]
MSETSYEVMSFGASRGFPANEAFTDELMRASVAGAPVLMLIGKDAGAALAGVHADERAAVLVELGVECLGVHTGESRATEGSKVLGFARFRLGEDGPSNLVELVRQPCSDEAAVAGARAVFEQAGLDVALCADSAGRILDRLLRPYFNDVLERLDEGLASADDMDLTLKMGLGYPEGPISLLERSGLEHHHDATEALFRVYGEPAYAPARRAVVAKARARGRGSS